MAAKRSETSPGQRISFTTSQSYDTVSARLYQSINTSGPITRKNLKQLPSWDRQSFTSLFNSHVGPHGFVQFYEFNHGDWVRLFGVGNGLRLKRVILGNPLIAITMLKHDLDAGLFVPVEVLLKELEGGKGTEVMYVLPSSLIAAGKDSEGLRKAAEELDRKLERLVEDIVAVPLKSRI